MLASRHSALGGFALILCAALGMLWLGAYASLDNALLDQQFRLLRRLAPESPPDGIVLIGIDERTYQALPEPSALWHPHLGKLLHGLAQARPAVVGFDVTLPTRSYNFLIPQYDISLLQGILAMRPAAPLVFGQSLDEKQRFRPIFPPYLAVAGENAVASVVICTDEDGVVRRFAENLCAGGAKTMTLAGRMAEHLGVRHPWEGLIDYTLGAPFGYIPMIDVLGWIDRGDQERLRANFAGKTVLLGAVLPFEDRHLLPVPLAEWDSASRLLPGMLIHAQALRSMLAHGLIQPLGMKWLALLAMLATLFWWHPGRRWKIALFVLSLPAIFAAATFALSQGVYVPAAGLMLCAGLGFFSRAAFEAFLAHRKNRQLSAAFSGLVSQHVFKEILSGKIKPVLGGERVRAAVLFADIRDFTTRSESMSPERTIDLLNSYFSEMTDAIQINGGMVDKFIGDGIMASFGSLQPLPNSSRCALEAAQEMIRRLAQLNLALQAQGYAPIAIGIGIHVGDVIAGNVGSISRYEYTLIGDTVNIASRLEGATKEHGYPVVCSAAVAQAAGDIAGLHDLGEHPIKGHSNIHMFGWLPPAPNASTV